MKRLTVGLICFITLNLLGAEIHDACRRGDLEAVKQIVAADPNAVKLLWDNKMTPLMLAARTNAAVTEFLLQHKSDPNQKDAMGCTAVHGAAIKHKSECIEILAKHGGDVNAKDPEGTTPAIFAAGKLGPNRKETLRTLAKHKADLTIRDKQGSSVRRFAQKDPQLAAILKELGAKY